MEGFFIEYDELVAYSGYVYLRQIFEPQDNTLLLQIDRCKVNETTEDIKIGDSVIQNARSIDVDESHPSIQLEFERYIAYSVRNESFTMWDDYEVFNGGSFRIYVKSRYLDFIEVGTIATHDYPGPFKHYGIVALNHVIDVVSTAPPTITFVDRTAE